MSIFNGLDSSLSQNLEDFIGGLNSLGDEGKLILLNFLEEERLPLQCNSYFVKGTISNLSNSNDTFQYLTSYYKSIEENDLLLRLFKKESTDKGVRGIHVTSRNRLVDNGYVEIAMDELPPSEINLKKPLGSGNYFLWITLEKFVNFKSHDSTKIRNLLGLDSITKDDYLYYFFVNLNGECWIPSAYDAFGVPPYRPNKKEQPWGLTRNLVDDREGVPELLILPLMSIEASSPGYLLNPRINDLPPTGYVEKRLEEFRKNSEIKKWKNL